MNNTKKNIAQPTFRPFLPLAIGLLITAILYGMFRWWGFLVIFPWIGLSISIGILLSVHLKGNKRLIGRKISLLMILPCLLLFVPIVNHENFQLEGVALIVLAGFFGKGFIHYAIAKLFGPLIWRRGFCGYACWTGAVLEWLPVSIHNGSIPRSYRNIRYLTLLLSLAIPVYLIVVLSYDPMTDYINKHEMMWMFVGNGIYYLIAVPLAFILKDKRAFCKYACPVSLVMKPASSIGQLKVRPNQQQACITCGACNKICPMGVDVMSAMLANRPVIDTECILCNDCRIVCPVDKIR